jgi:hypothetical protein
MMMPFQENTRRLLDRISWVVVGGTSSSMSFSCWGHFGWNDDECGFSDDRVGEGCNSLCTGSIFNYPSEPIKEGTEC